MNEPDANLVSSSRDVETLRRSTIEPEGTTSVAISKVHGDHYSDDGTLLAGLYEASLEILKVIRLASRDREDANESLKNANAHVSKRSMPATSENEEIDTKESDKILAKVLASLILWGELITSGKVQSTNVSSPSLYRDIARLFTRFGRTLVRVARRAPCAGYELERELQSWLDKATFALSTSHSKTARDVVTNAYPESEHSDASSQLSLSLWGEDDCVYEALAEDMALLMELIPSISYLAAMQGSHTVGIPLVRAEFQTSVPAQSFISSVMENYPDAPASLVNRLGEANWQRWCRLRLQQDANIAMQYECAKSVFIENSTVFHDSAIGTSLDSGPEDKQSNASRQSFASTLSIDAHHFHRVPPEPPEIALGQPFLCSLCLTPVHNVRNRMNWKLHVFKDLQAYICLFDDCDQHLQTFPTRKAWSEHDLKIHREQIRYQCFECDTLIRTQAAFRTHLIRKHNPKESWINVLVDNAARTISLVDTWVCPLCERTGFPTANKFTTHVCRHMEDIALSTLPPDMYGEDSEDEDAGSDADSSLLTANDECEDHIEALAKEIDRSQPALPLSDSHRYISEEIDGSVQAILEDIAPWTPVSDSSQNVSSDIHVAEEINLAPQAKKQKMSFPCTICAGARSFSTTNDLARHRRTVHQIVEPGEKVWQCNIGSCSAARKVWVRQDNFKQHVQRMHKETDVEDINPMVVAYNPSLHDLAGTVGPRPLIAADRDDGDDNRLQQRDVIKQKPEQ